MFDAVIGAVAEGFGVDVAGPERFGRFPIAPRMRVDRVVVRPHQRELEVTAVRRAEEAVADAALPVRPVEKVVPVEDESVDAVVGGQLDLNRHVVRVRLVVVAEKRHFGLFVAGKARGGVLGGAPFGPSLSVDRLIARVHVPVGEIVGADSRTGVHDGWFLGFVIDLPRTVSGPRSHNSRRAASGRRMPVSRGRRARAR